MSLRNRIYQDHITVTEEQAQRLSYSTGTWYDIEVRPPKNKDVPTTLREFAAGIRELQTKWLKIRNASPTIAFEIRRHTPDKLTFQFSTPTKRLERKVRTQLSNQVPGVEFGDGVEGLPVGEESTAGGGFLTAGRRDWYPFRTDFDEPPVNSLVSTFHRHAMQNTSFVVQVLFKPVVGERVQRWLWKKQAYKQIQYLKKEKEQLWGSRSPTKREKRQADSIEAKAGNSRFHTTIRFAVIGADEYTKSRVKELAGAYNTYENPETGQYLDTVTVEALREQRIFDFLQAVADRSYSGWGRRFQSSLDELAAFVSLPSNSRENIQFAQP
ncbi:hypothetical protein [Haloplanus natans]|uniref:hypothetical protein n=1 Tax=Haloplanus natans TaxID=376171 RepID=UPI000677F565|nr:hypothetical protein [Haloplanus natans]